MSIVRHKFDGSSKQEWFWADLEATLYVGVGAYFVVGFLMMCIWRLTGWDAIPTMVFLFRIMTGHLGVHALWLLLIPPAIPVFIFRWNPKVYPQPSRSFRYICRWL